MRNPGWVHEREIGCIKRSPLPSAARDSHEPRRTSPNPGIGMAAKNQRKPLLSGSNGYFPVSRREDDRLRESLHGKEEKDRRG